MIPTCLLSIVANATSEGAAYPLVGTLTGLISERFPQGSVPQGKGSAKDDGFGGIMLNLAGDLFIECFEFP